jgi:pre-mRNA-splicing helicase BRR2
VLTADNRSRDPKEPDGTAETLWGKINPKAFGDRVQFAKPGADGGEKCASPRE